MQAWRGWHVGHHCHVSQAGAVGLVLPMCSEGSLSTCLCDFVFALGACYLMNPMLQLPVVPDSFLDLEELVAEHHATMCKKQRVPTSSSPAEALPSPLSYISSAKSGAPRLRGLR